MGSFIIIYATKVTFKKKIYFLPFLINKTSFNVFSIKIKPIFLSFYNMIPKFRLKRFANFVNFQRKCYILKRFHHHTSSQIHLSHRHSAPEEQSECLTFFASPKVSLLQQHFYRLNRYFFALSLLISDLESLDSLCIISICEALILSFTIFTCHET